MKHLSTLALFLLSLPAVAQQSPVADAGGASPSSTPPLKVLKDKGQEYQYYDNDLDERVIHGSYKRTMRMSDMGGANMREVQIKGQYQHDKRTGRWNLTETNAQSKQVTASEQFTYAKGSLVGPYTIEKKFSNNPQKVHRAVRSTFGPTSLPQGPFTFVNAYNPVHGQYLSCIIKGQFNRFGRYDGDWVISYKWRDGEELEDRRTFRNGVLAKWVNKSLTKGLVNGRLDSTASVSAFFQHYDSLTNVSVVNGVAYSLDLRPDRQVSVKTANADQAFRLEEVIGSYLGAHQDFFGDKVSAFDRIQPQAERPRPMADIILTDALIERYKGFLYSIAARSESDLDRSFRDGNLEESEAAFLSEWEQINREEAYMQQIAGFAQALKRSGTKISPAGGDAEVLLASLAQPQRKLQAGKVAYYQALRKKSPEKARAYSAELAATRPLVPEVEAKAVKLKADTTSATILPAPVPDENKVYNSVEQMPELPGGGGNQAIVAAIQKATRYPALALRNQVEGRVFVSFIVDEQGQISDIKVVKGLGSGLDEETARAVSTLPKLVPGKQDGRAVRVSLTEPVMWRIQ